MLTMYVMKKKQPAYSPFYTVRMPRQRRCAPRGQRIPSSSAMPSPARASFLTTAYTRSLHKRLVYQSIARIPLSTQIPVMPLACAQLLRSTHTHNVRHEAAQPSPIVTCMSLIQIMSVTLSPCLGIFRHDDHHAHAKDQQAAVLVHLR